MNFCAVPRVAPEDFPELAEDIAPGAEGVAVLAGGCFWCVDAVYRQLDGVLQVTAGYAGGTSETADYRTVCSGTTGHAEVIMVRFDPSRITFGQILKVFFSVAHDPTQLNRQGNDTGRQYRSAIFYADDDQRRVAAAYIKELDAAKVYGDKIVTSLEPLETFFEAEDYHQNYAALNPDQPYIAHISMPKVAKVRKHFSDRVKGS
ncbi:MAG: peptide-methionine (S)-S-oxide reductase MsrA [Proteobacteria bacterium]|nr:peptide-methionine (S)-S-oxide reductase MsrA [Pseudomonadota bacterium]MDA1059819.1 peptide-methionine (S)-S-oxide reductase MsrA [Pseudomonadota bacterium]